MYGNQNMSDGWKPEGKRQMLIRLPDHDRGCDCITCQSIRDENAATRAFMGWR